MGTTERRKEIMKILCRRKHETIPNLAFELGVSEKTIGRDIIALSDEPIYTKRGKYGGGVYIIEGYSMNNMYMTHDEIDLLMKVRKIVEDKLSHDEISLFNKIINIYSKPTVK